MPLLLALYVLAPHRVSDADALSRLATGRLLAHGLQLPASDPFTFSNPSAPFGDPEWLGDLLLYGVFDRFGDAGLQDFALLMAALGYALALGLGMAFGGGAWGMSVLLLSTLPAVAPRVSARNDVHLLWIVPLFAWLALRAREQRSHRSSLFALFALGWLWANLHASFVLGVPLAIAALLDAREYKRVLPWLALLAYLALPFAGLGGSSSYRQLIDHSVGAAVYRSLISEWQSPLASGGVLAVLPLHLLTLLGMAIFWRERKRVRWLPLAMFVIGVVLAYRSRRFLPLMAAMIAPALGVGLSGLRRDLPRRAQRVLQIAASLCVLAYCALGLRSLLHRGPSPVFGDRDSPERAAEFMRDHAPAGSRVANLFNDGPWLVFLSAPRVQHYLDPRNNLGAAWLERYVDEVLADPAKFDAEVSRLAITLALVRFDERRGAVLAQHVAASNQWSLVYWDGTHALYARRVEADRELIDHFAYRVLQPTLELSYLDSLPANDPRLERDLRELEKQSPAIASALRGYRLLRSGDRASAEEAVHAFERALQELPATEGLLGYWAESLRAAGLGLGQRSTSDQ
ncbi:MAG TPA: hypothetical protein VGI70_01425 [Polyangiales bacterium]